jgi:hypothetical protein
MPGGPSFCQGAQVACGDGDLCTADFCDGQTGGCLHQPTQCNDNNPCTNDVCGPQEGQCSYQPLPLGTACSGAGGCILGGTCGNGEGGYACYGSANIGAPCDDGQDCTEQDLCRNDFRGGANCVGRSITCDDEDACTYGGCDHQTGSCMTVPVTCNDGNACTLDLCDPAQAQCDWSQPAPFNEVSSIAFATAASFSWSPTPGTTRWNSYRGTIPAGLLGSRPPGSTYDHTCFESADAASNGALTSIDAGNPTVGTGYYYDATEERDCGEGPLGRNSALVVRPNTAPCPTPP